MTWLSDRLAMADTAAVVLAAPDQADIPRDIQDELLEAIGATAIAIRSGSVSRLIAAVEMPPEVDATVDLRAMAPTEDVVEAFRTLFSAKGADPPGRRQLLQRRRARTGDRRPRRSARRCSAIRSACSGCGRRSR